MMTMQANRRLAKMTDRYLLIRDPEQPLELNVIDNYQAGEIRSTKNLSGGESFIVSLALALGLSHMVSRNVRIDSLFLDEGFGTLDEEALETALETLAGLQAGREAHRRHIARRGAQGADRHPDRGDPRAGRPQQHNRPRLPEACEACRFVTHAALSGVRSYPRCISIVIPAKAGVIQAGMSEQTTGGIHSGKQKKWNPLYRCYLRPCEEDMGTQ